MQRITERNRQSRTGQNIMALRENSADITAAVQKIEIASMKTSDRKSINNSRWQEKLGELRDNAGDLTALKVKKGGAPPAPK